MNIKTFNLIASLSAFTLGALYIFSEGSASINANVIGAGSADGGLTAIFGIVMIIGAIGLFIVSMHSTDNHALDLERMVRRTKHHEEFKAEAEGEAPEMHKTP